MSTHFYRFAWALKIVPIDDRSIKLTDEEKDTIINEIISGTTSGIICVERTEG